MERLADRFLRETKLTLGSIGFQCDPGKVIKRNGCWICYHYTRQSNYDSIIKEDSGLYARRSVVGIDNRPDLKNHFLVEAFLNPYPQWLDKNPYYKELGKELFDKYIGDLLLEIAIPIDSCKVYVADYAHMLECKYKNRNGIAPMNIGYNCKNGHEVVVADVNSYIEMEYYNGDHVAPVVSIVREGKGIAIKSQWITISKEQPRRMIHGEK